MIVVDFSYFAPGFCELFFSYFELINKYTRYNCVNSCYFIGAISICWYITLHSHLSVQNSTVALFIQDSMRTLYNIFCAYLKHLKPPTTFNIQNVYYYCMINDGIKWTRHTYQASYIISHFIALLLVVVSLFSVINGDKIISNSSR